MSAAPRVAKASIWAWRTRDGPQPKRPSAGSSSVGILMSAMCQVYREHKARALASDNRASAARPKGSPVTDLIDTTEMYLRTILELEEEGQIPMRARISERLSHSGPTVSQTIARMERLGLVQVGGDRHLGLTPEGRSEATKVMRKHRLAELLLSDVIGLEWEFVHEEACRWEHVMSDMVEQKILGLLKNPHVSPYGNPIPGLAELGLQESPKFHDGVVSVASIDFSDTSKVYTLRRIGEPLQVDVQLLADLRQLGIVPGARLTFEHRARRVFIKVEGAHEGESLVIDDAAHLFVEG